MVASQEQIRALSEAVAVWRMQECVEISGFAVYVYYVLTTMDEEISVILSQKWSRGNILYVCIRYGALLWSSIHVTRDYRTYLTIKPVFCKILEIVHGGGYVVQSLMSNFILGLCLGALLQVQGLCLVAIVVLSCGLSFVNGVFMVVASIQYPAEAVSALDVELGYACYVPTADKYVPGTTLNDGKAIRAYLTLTATILLAVLGVATLVVRYKGQRGRLIQVLSRDGGLQVMTLMTIRLGSAVSSTPGVIQPDKWDSHPVNVALSPLASTLVPILVQRLLINMRKIDYPGSRPLASKLLFTPGSEDDFNSTLGTSNATHQAPNPRLGGHDPGEKPLARGETEVGANA